MLALGIDQSFTSTGIVILDTDKQIQHHEAIRTDKRLSTVQRIKQVYDRIKELVWAFEPDVVVIEGLGFGATGNATRDLGGLFYSIQDRLIHDLGFSNIEVIAPTTLKKHATGSGKAKKEMLLESLPDHVSTILRNNYLKSKGLMDLVDAYWLADIGADLATESATEAA